MAKELRDQSGRLINHTARRLSEEKPVVNREGENNNSGMGSGGQTDRTKQSIIHLTDLQPVNQSNNLPLRKTRRQGRNQSVLPRGFS